MKTGTSRHWNFKNWTKGSRVTTIYVGNMKNKAISIPKHTLNSNSVVLRDHVYSEDSIEVDIWGIMGDFDL